MTIELIVIGALALMVGLAVTAITVWVHGRHRIKELEAEIRRRDQDDEDTEVGMSIKVVKRDNAS